jgi:hypothetical protein
MKPFKIRDNGVQDNGFVTECKVTVTESDYKIVGNFHAMIPFDVTHEPEGVSNELDHIEQYIEQLGQQFQRVLCRQTLETRSNRKAKNLNKSKTPSSHKHRTTAAQIAVEWDETPRGSL